MDNGPGKVLLCLKEYAKKIKADSKDAKKWAGLGSDINVQEKSCPSVCQDLPFCTVDEEVREFTSRR